MKRFPATLSWAWRYLQQPVFDANQPTVWHPIDFWRQEKIRSLEAASQSEILEHLNRCWQKKEQSCVR
jgi:hypothetical protein